MKRLIALLVLVAAIMTTVGCGSDTSGTTKATKANPAGATTSTDTKPKTP